MKITIVGIGALGSHLVQFLRNEDVEINVIDFDRIETKNTQSQFHGRPHTGKAKTISLQQVMDYMFKRKITTNSNKLTALNDVTLLKGTDLIVDCLDNFEARTLVQNYARASGTPCLHGALAPNGEFGRVVWDSQFVIDSEAGVGGATCEDGLHLPFIAVVAACMARSVQAFLGKSGKSGKQLGYSITPSGVFSI